MKESLNHLTQVLFVHSPVTVPSCSSQGGICVGRSSASGTLERKEERRLRDRSSALSLATPSTCRATNVKLNFASAK